jgi:hypothetical protein
MFSMLNPHLEPLPPSPPLEPPPISSCDTDQSGALRELHDGVIRLWLSSMRPSYRRAVKGRTGLGDLSLVPSGRHRAA